MCTVLQQHLNHTSNGFQDYDNASATPRPASSAATTASLYRHISPVRLAPQPTYSYLQDLPNLKRPIDPYDRKISTPAMHFHLPSALPGESGGGGSGGRRSRSTTSSYMQQLLGRRSRSHSRTGMRVLVDRIQSATPRARSPHMNNEEPINLSHFPDGRQPEEKPDRTRPIERDDFPAPPFAYGTVNGYRSRRRHHSEPGSSMRSSVESTPVVSSDEEDDDVDVPDEKLDKTEEELKKISTGMGQVFLAEIAVEKQRRKLSKSRLIDPRSAARTPAAKKEPHYRLRYDSPVNASPSRVADHLKPWDDELDGGTTSRRSNVTTPFLPGTTTPAHGGHQRVVSPVRPGYSTPKAQTLPSRFSPTNDLMMMDKTYSGEISDYEQQHRSPSSSRGENIRVSSTYTQGLQAATPRSQPSPQSHHKAASGSGSDLNRSLPNMAPLQAPNIYPLHLLFTTNYRLPGDVDRCNLEKHLSDADFDMVFRCSREEFYRLPYWKRCDLKRKYHLF